MKFILVIIFCFSSIFLNAQSSNCKDYLYSYLQNIQKFNNPSKGNVYFLDYSVKNQFRQTSGLPKNEESRVKMYVSHSTAIIESPQFLMYKDLQEIYCVLHKSRTIVYDNSLTGVDMYDSQRFENVVAMQKMLIDSAQIIACSKRMVDGVEYYRIISEIHGIPESPHIKEVVFLYNAATSMLRSIHIYYADNYPVIQQEITYNTINFNANITLLPAAQYIYDKKGDILPQYMGYKVIENE